MKKYVKVVLILIVILNTSYIFSQSVLRVQNGQTFHIDQSLSNLIIDEFVMEDNSTIIIGSDVANWHVQARKAYFGKNTKIFSTGKNGGNGKHATSIPPTPGKAIPGTKGKNGEHGHLGKNGANITLEMGIYAMNDLVIISTGGNGGNGGNGGRGGKGGRASCNRNKKGARGGDGGNAGYAGKGGNGGDILVKHWAINGGFLTPVPTLSSGGLGLRMFSNKGVGGKIPGQSGKGGPGGNGTTCSRFYKKGGGPSGGYGKKGYKRGAGEKGSVKSEIVVPVTIAGNSINTNGLNKVNIAGAQLMFQGTDFSSKDNMRGWSFSNNTASYILWDKVSRTSKLYIRPYSNCKKYGAITRQVKFSSADNIRAWHWDKVRKICSYLTVNNGKTYLVVRNFDGEFFGDDIKKIQFSGSDILRGWTWDVSRSKCSYLVFSGGKTILYTRFFDGETFGKDIKEALFSTNDNVKAFSWDRHKNYLNYFSCYKTKRTTIQYKGKFDTSLLF